MDKSLQDKAISFKGKDYVEVKERVNYFNETYLNGCIQTVKLEGTDRVEFKAVVIPDVDKPSRFFTGHSQASFQDTTSFVNKTSAMENAETSAVGRALAFMGIGVISSIASIDEVHKANSVSVPQNTSVKVRPAITEPITDVPFTDYGEPEKEVLHGQRISHYDKVIGGKCPNCADGKFVKNPKTGKIFCDQKCWVK